MAMTLGFYANAVLLGPAGFDMALAYGPFLAGSEASQFHFVAGRLADELAAEGVKVEGIRYYLEDLRQASIGNFFKWRSPFDRTISKDCLREYLSLVHPESYMKAAGRVVLSIEEGGACLFRGVNARRSRRLLQPAKPWHWWTPSYNRDFECFASRLDLAGRDEAARLAWREAGTYWVGHGKKMNNYARGSGERGDHKFACFQLKDAVDCFRSAARCFERARSELNRAKAMTMAKLTSREVMAEASTPDDRAARRITFLEMVEELATPVGREPDHDLVHFVRYAMLGTRDGMETFLREAAVVLGVSPQKVLNALVESEVGFVEEVGRAMDKVAKLLGTDVIAAIDPLEAGFLEREPESLANVKGAGLFGRLQELLGRDGFILDRLVVVARRYKSGVERTE